MQEDKKHPHGESGSEHDQISESQTNSSPSGVTDDQITGADAVSTESGTTDIAKKSMLEDVTANSPDDDRIAEMMDNTIDVAAFAPAMAALEPADAADALEELDVDDAADVVYEMEDEVAAHDLAEMQLPLAVTILEDLACDHGPLEPARYIDLMDPDDAVDLLQAMSDEMAFGILNALPGEKAAILERLLVYDPETAGGMMTTEFVSVSNLLTRKEAIDRIREQSVWAFNIVYCVDSSEQLVGVVSFRRLLISEDDVTVDSIMTKSTEVIRPDLDREEIAEKFQRYDYTVMPVVDQADRLLGVITIDDVIDIIHEEQTEDAYRMVGAGKSEAIYSSVWDKFKGRFPWLIVNLFTSCIAAIVVLQFDDLIARIAVLAVLMPVIANQAGNAGQQSLAVTLRGIVLGEIRTTHVWPLVWRELGLGLLTGLIVGVSAGIFITILGATGIYPEINWHLGTVVMIAMTGSLAAGCLVGTAMPLLMERLNRDPATASTIFLTMVTDSVSFLTFLGLARLVL